MPCAERRGVPLVGFRVRNTANAQLVVTNTWVLGQDDGLVLSSRDTPAPSLFDLAGLFGRRLVYLDEST